MKYVYKDNRFIDVPDLKVLYDITKDINMDYLWEFYNSFIDFKKSSVMYEKGICIYDTSYKRLLLIPIELDYELDEDDDYIDNDAYIEDIRFFK